MKVTVCFGSVRVVVPCGDGDILVRDLIRQATLRYKKATGKSSDAWVVVHNVRSQAGGGILDPDDRLHDVADDREQIVADFEDADGLHGGGDGASSPSPDFQSEGSRYPQTDIEVTGEQILGAAPLQVRRGSEPALNQLGVPPATPAPPPAPAAIKRWSATPILSNEQDTARDRRLQRKGESRVGYLTPDLTENAEHCGSEDQKSAFTRFVRDGSSRLSMQFVVDSGLRWAEAVERVQSKSLPRDHRRKEPLGQANTNSPVSRRRVRDSDTEDENGETVEYVVLHNESGPLGIHVVPDYDRLGKDRGLLVQGIEPGGRIDRDGRLAVYDRIIEINGSNLLNMPFNRVQEIFKNSLQSRELRLRVVKHRLTTEQPKKPPAPVFPRSINKSLDEKESGMCAGMVEGEERSVLGVNAKVATVSPTKKVSPAHPSRNTNTVLASNTRKIGRKIELELVKGAHGLGFSVTTRDNPAGGNCPIYIKNILPKGAAVEDGRLKPGDRLLEVNGVDMTVGKTQAEAVTVLRNAPAGSKVSIVVSRQEDSNGSTSPKLPRPLVARSDSPTFQAAEQDALPDSMVARTTPLSFQPPDKANDDGLVFPWKHREILTFDIPVHDSEKAGLGVSVKGKTSANHSSNSSGSSVELGIFVKSVLHGGAASRDGRLRTNDQLLNVNGISLLNQSNSDAMETLRRAMLHTEGPVPGVITLQVARRLPSPPGISNGYQHSGQESLSSSSGAETFGGKLDNDMCTLDNSADASENSDTTVIFLNSNKEDNSSQITHNSHPKFREGKILGVVDHISVRNPVIDRLTGGPSQVREMNPHALRNESYYRATNDTWNTTMLISGTTNLMKSPTINQPASEMILIEEEREYQKERTHHPQQHNSRKNSIMPIEREADRDINNGGNKIPVEQNAESRGSDATYASQLSLEEAAAAAAGFSRDAFGRQSMSEKRHATLDAKNTDTYQRNKKLREERERQRNMQLQQQQMNDKKRTEQDIGNIPAKGNATGMVRANSIESVISLARSVADSEKSEARKRHEFGPALGMKKSSSLESLQTMVQEIQMQDDSDPAYVYRNAQGAVRVVRGRGCNESFRAAVDRSYDAPLGDIKGRMGEMETLAEEDGVSVDCNASRDNGKTSIDPRGVGFVCGNGQPNINSGIDPKHGKGGKKKPGIFKGIGSMFRFGKHRKTLDVPLQVALQVDEEGPAEGDCEREAARKAAQEEQQRIQEQYRRLLQRQRQMDSNQGDPPSCNGGSEGGSSGSSHHHHREGSTSSSGMTGPPTQTRTERIHQLRAQHQRRHAERRGLYPMDDREERYEEAIRQHLEQTDAHSGRPGNYDLYGEMARPGSRVGITDPSKFSHYVNYEEIQQHLNRRQQHYHSQRRDNRELHQRPVSNFYEYESVQTVMSGNQLRPPGTLIIDANSNSLPRRIQQERASLAKNINGPNNYQRQSQRAYQQFGSNCDPNSINTNHMHNHVLGTRSIGTKVNNLGGRTQGPFVTQVMIGQQSHTPGSKV